MERLDLERERRRLRLRVEPDGGKEATALSVFSTWYEGTERWGYQQASWGSLDEAARRDLGPRLERVAELERMISDDLWLVLGAGPSEERSRRAAWLAEWERLVEECSGHHRG